MAIIAVIGFGISAKSGQNKQTIYELGEIIESFLRKDVTNIGWDYLSESKNKIQWKTIGIEEKNTIDGSLYYRYGTIDIRVNGKASTKLQTRVSPILWSIVYSSSSSPKFGVETITILPEIYPNTCFGTLYNGCDFEIEQTLKLRQVATSMLCENKMPGFSQKVYKISKANRSLIIWLNMSYGSGGATSEVVIPPQSRANACTAADQSLDTTQTLDTAKHNAFQK